MARRTFEGDREPDAAVESAPRARTRVSAAKPDPLPRMKIAVRVVAITVIVLAAALALHQFEQFLIRDTRFAINGADSQEAASVQILGAAHASHRAIETVFAEDMGKSVYLLPLTDRRATLRTVDWVKDASVGRVWPNRVVVRVAERKPVAFVTLGAARFGLIDEDGVILPSVSDRFHLPVLRGVQAKDALADRRERVQRMLRVLRELGANSDKIAEVDVTDREDVKLTQAQQGSIITLLLGDRNFSARYQNFVNHYSEIKEKLPDATTLDLRLEDRITVVDQ